MGADTDSEGWPAKRRKNFRGWGGGCVAPVGARETGTEAEEFLCFSWPINFGVWTE